MAIDLADLSPNQLAKRVQIVEAAQRVILRDGPARCTTRQVARESGLNQGLIYYYFGSQDEIIDAAMDGLADELEADILKAGTAGEEPAEHFWALFENYLDNYRRPGVAGAWFEYLLLRWRQDRTEVIARTERKVLAALTRVLEEAGAEDPPVQARIVVSYIVGVIVRSFTSPRSLEELAPEIRRLAPQRLSSKST